MGNKSSKKPETLPSTHTHINVLSLTANSTTSPITPSPSAECTINELKIDTSAAQRTSYKYDNCLSFGFSARPFSKRLADVAANFWKYVEALPIEDRLVMFL